MTFIVFFYFDNWLQFLIIEMLHNGVVHMLGAFVTAMKDGDRELIN